MIAGQHFLAIESTEAGMKITGQGFIRKQVGPQHWYCQFTAPGVPYARVLGIDKITSLALFSSAQELMAFAKSNYPDQFPAPVAPADEFPLISDEPLDNAKEEGASSGPVPVEN